MTDDAFKLTGANQSAPALVIAPEGRRIVTIHGDGRIEIVADLAVDDAAKEFLEALAKYAFGKRLYDTRTHAAVPREPSDEVVERVARAICRSNDFDAERDGAFECATTCLICEREARAAIAALVQGQTQGGEDGR